jgi:hypothetical protein
MEAGTHPGAGQLYQRLLLTYAPWAAGDDPETVTEIMTAYGWNARLALLPNIAVRDTGDVDGSLRIKQRIWQRDSGPIDTWRASVQAGIAWPAHADPGARAGLVSTTIRGRHGFNAQIDWNDAAPPAERFAVNAAYLYRWYPARFSSASAGAWYSMIESLHHFSGSGAHAPEWAVGALYEARRWAAEISWRTGDRLVREQQAVALGVRYLW